MGTVLSSEKYIPEDIPYFTNDDFKSQGGVGQGQYSTVNWGNVRRYSRPVAVKKFCELNEYSDREIQLLKGVGTIFFLYNIVHFSSHPNIITIRGVIWDRNRGKPIYSGYVMDNESLEIYDFSKNYDDCLISKWIQQIGAGVQYLHKRNIIHRDIKPPNILLASVDHLKLADFGLARVVSGRDSNTAANWIGTCKVKKPTKPQKFSANQPPTIGTESYKAPEVLVSGGNYGPAADVFSFGVTIWEIIHRKHPGQHVTASKDSYGNYCVDLPMERSKIHFNASNFIKRCWQTSIPDRPSIEEIIQFGSNFEQINSGGTIIPVGHQLDPIQETVTIQGNHFDSIDGTLDSIPQNIDKLNTILVMGGWDFFSRRMTVLSNDRSHWIDSQLKPPYDVFGSGAVFLHNELYVVGGFLNPKALYKLERNRKSKRLADMNVGRGFIVNSCLEANGYIWVFGGGKPMNPLKSVERYDPKKNKWTLMPEMSTGRWMAAAVFWKDRIIVSGGRSKEGLLTSSAECFLLETGEWTQFPPLPDRLVGHSLVSYENKLILMGGGNTELLNQLQKSVWEMDPLQPNDGWKSLPPMKYPRGFIPGLVFDQEIYALGGRGDSKAVLDCVEIFDGKSWRDGPSFPCERYSHSAVVIPQS